jgi:hypothetical protein
VTTQCCTFLVLPRANKTQVAVDAIESVDRVARRRFAEQVARKYDVDAGDVEHVLSNLALQPMERLRKSMQRARLRGIAYQSHH